MTDDIVEFKGKYYNIPASKVEPKPIQKPGIPVYLGGFTSNTFPRIIRYNLNGWLSVAQFRTGSLKDFENSIKSLKEQASRVSKNQDNFRTIMLTYPKVMTDQPSNNNDKNRYPLTGTIDKIGDDIRGMKEIGVDHIIFDYMFAPIGSNVDEMIDMSKELSKFAK